MPYTGGRRKKLKGWRRVTKTTRRPFLATAGGIVKRIASNARAGRWSLKKGLMKKLGRKKKSAVVAAGVQVKGGHHSMNYLGKKATRLVKPMWFRQILRENTPSVLTAQYNDNITCAVGSKTSFTVWKDMGIYDIQAALNATIGLNSAAAPGNNPNKVYMCDFERVHVFRNAAPGAVHLELYELRAREVIASYAQVGGVLDTLDTISPPAVATAATGGTLISPVMFTQSFTDEAKGVNAVQKVASTDPAVTPFMSPALCGRFKIRKLVVTWPNGEKGHEGDLLPGDELNLTCSRQQPYSVSWTKYGLSASAANFIGGTFEVLRETPLIMGFLRGTPSHDAMNLGRVNYGNGVIDHMETIRFKVVATQVFGVNTSQYSSVPVAFAGNVEEVQAVTGAEVNEAES